MYCGAALPAGAAEATGPEAPPELDDLVRRAMTGGGGTARIKEVLSRFQATRESGGRGAPATPARRAPEGAGAPAAPASSEEDLRAVVASVKRARAAWARDPAEAARQLEAAAAALERARDALGDPLPAPAPRATPPAEPPPVVMPPYRQPLALVVEGSGQESDVPRLAAALEVDVVTARMAALARHPRVALRGSDRLDLAVRAGRVRQDTGMRASVQERDHLLAIPPPLLLLRRVAGRAWAATRAAGWLPGAADVEETERIELGEVTLVAVGEVVVRHLREAAVTRRSASWKLARAETELRAGAEQRAGVLDLHGPALFCRIVAGVTDLAGLPGHDPTSLLRSWRGLVEAIPSTWPDARRVGSRTCHPPARTTRGEEAGDDDGRHVDGWPEWEEHTRLCRLHVLGP